MSWMDDYDSAWIDAGESSSSSDGISGCGVALLASMFLIPISIIVIDVLLMIFNVDFRITSWLWETVMGFLLGKQ